MLKCLSPLQKFEPSAIAIVFMNTVNILNGFDVLIHYVLKRLSSFDLKVHFYYFSNCELEGEAGSISRLHIHST